MGKIMYKGEEFQGRIERLSGVIEITMAEYSELTPEEIANGYFYIPDYNVTGGYSGKAISMLGDIYIPQGGNMEIHEIYSNTGSSAPNTVELTNPYTDYDAIILFGSRTGGNVAYKSESFYLTRDISVNDKITVGDDAQYSWWTVTDASTLTNAGSNMNLLKIHGVKFQGGE